MDRKDITRMAREAGIRLASQSDTIDPRNVYSHELERFANLVAAAKQEEIESTLMRLHEQAADRHNYFQHAIKVLRGEA